MKKTLESSVIDQMMLEVWQKMKPYVAVDVGVDLLHKKILTSHKFSRFMH